MKILVINCGSSSLKYQLLDMNGEEVLCIGLVERIGIEGSVITHEATGMDEVVIKEPMQDHTKALELVLDAVVHKDYGAVKSMDEIGAIGHRVVHGGEEFASSVIIDDNVMKAIENCIELAPLHNPPNIMGIEACTKLMPNTPNIAVFDTAFHQSMDEDKYIYALPYEYYEKYQVRRYGFHGTSHKYVAERAADMLGKDLKDLNLITCHLGNGASICAIENGKSIDTSMGLTPLEGLVMGTRSGDIDPAIIPFLINKENMTSEDVSSMLNNKSGVLGISGLSSDFRDLEVAANEGNKRAELALSIFVNRVKKYIGAYMATMSHVDAIVFTAGIGENSGYLRGRVCDGLEGLGIKLDLEANDVRGVETKLNKEDSPISILLIPTNEELMIAKETLELVSK